MDNPTPAVILPPFTKHTAQSKVQLAQDASNTCDRDRVALAHTEDSQWRNRDEFFSGRDAIRTFLTRKWQRELGYRLQQELWAFSENRQFGVGNSRSQTAPAGDALLERCGARNRA